MLGQNMLFITLFQHPEYTLLRGWDSKFHTRTKQLEKL